MCGIGGWFGRDAGSDAKELARALRHRGPDGEGAWSDDESRAGLVHTRLAILDLSEAGHQPMGCSGAEGRSANSWIVLNGEIYNFRQLRSELEIAGEQFLGESDTEVVIRLLEVYGAAALPRLAGMFAFAWYDSRSGRGLLARDPFGIKPLYYTRGKGGVAFASEVGALKSMVGSATISPAAMRDTLMWGSVPEPLTLFEEIIELPAGSALEWDGSEFVISKWHHVDFGATEPVRNSVAVAREALLESVERHLVSDVPVGIFLSGGIDSTAVLALAREVAGASAELRTFSIGFDEAAYDESSVAQKTADHFGAHHTEWLMRADEGRGEVAGYMAAMDQPTIDGFNTWCVSKMARRAGMKVVLSGLGGDEMFGGYGSFQRMPQFERMHGMPRVLRRIMAATFANAPAGSRWLRLAEFLRGPGTALGAFHVQRGIYTESEARELARELTGTDPGPADWNVEGLPADELDRVSFLETTRYMRNQLLRDSDVFSMAHGLELRVPFVDARLADSLASVPPALRFAKGKQLLLDAVPEVPSWVRGQPKRGFRFPFQEWTKGSFGDVLSRADAVSGIPLVTWYRRWALAVVLQNLA